MLSQCASGVSSLVMLKYNRMILKNKPFSLIDWESKQLFKSSYNFSFYILSLDTPVSLFNILSGIQLFCSYLFYIQLHFSQFKHFMLFIFWILTSGSLCFPNLCMPLNALASKCDHSYIFVKLIEVKEILKESLIGFRISLANKNAPITFINEINYQWTISHQLRDYRWRRQAQFCSSKTNSISVRWRNSLRQRRSDLIRRIQIAQIVSNNLLLMLASVTVPVLPWVVVLTLSPISYDSLNCNGGNTEWNSVSFVCWETFLFSGHIWEKWALAKS